MNTIEASANRARDMILFAVALLITVNMMLLVNNHRVAMFAAEERAKAIEMLRAEIKDRSSDRWTASDMKKLTDAFEKANPHTTMPEFKPEARGE